MAKVPGVYLVPVTTWFAVKAHLSVLWGNMWYVWINVGDVETRAQERLGGLPWIARLSS